MQQEEQQHTLSNIWHVWYYAPEAHTFQSSFASQLRDVFKFATVRGMFNLKKIT